MEGAQAVLRLFAIFLSLLWAAGAGADVSNPYSRPLGELEAFSANTGVADDRSTGAVFYNPGALARIESSRVSVSGSTYMFFTTTFDNAIYMDRRELSYTGKGFNTVPSTLVSTYKMKNSVLALSVLVPDALNYDNHSSWDTGQNTIEFLHSSQNQELWLGASYAYKPTDTWALGLSLFGVNRKENVINSFIITAKTAANTARFVSSGFQTHEVSPLCTRRTHSAFGLRDDIAEHDHTCG